MLVEEEEEEEERRRRRRRFVFWKKISFHPIVHSLDTKTTCKIFAFISQQTSCSGDCKHYRQVYWLNADTEGTWS